MARLGGDEFIVCAPGITPADLATLVERLRADLARPHQVYGDLVQVGASIGTHLAAPGDDAVQSIKKADRAMYEAKRTSADRRPA